MNLAELHERFGSPIVAGTGHRPDKLAGYGWNPTKQKIFDETKKFLAGLEAKAVISGMALGFDQILAIAALELKLPLIAAVPFEGQESMWPPKSQETYRTILGKATEVIFVSEPGYAAWKMMARNRWMVDNCDILLACWNGTPGGTANCLKYANKVKREVLSINMGSSLIVGDRQP